MMASFMWDNLFRKNSAEKTLSSKLRQNILFRDLNEAEMKLVEKIVHVRNYRPGETIFRQGELGVGMYIIARGSVNIYVEEVDPKTSEVKSNLITQLESEDFLGDLALVEENSRRSATAVTQEESQLIGFFKPDLLEIAQRSPQAGVKIMLRLGSVLGTRLRETTQKIGELRKELKK